MVLGSPKTVVMLMMMVMVVMHLVAVHFHMAGLLCALLMLCLQLQRCVSDAVLRKLCANGLLDGMRLSVGYDVHRCVIALTIHRPNVDMVDVNDSLDFEQMLSQLLRLNAVGGFFQQRFKYLLQGFDRVGQDE